jgi:hypothetical protein
LQKTSTLEIERDETRKLIKELRDEVDLFKRARDETVDYVDERVEERVRKLRRCGCRGAQEGRIRFEVTIGGEYGEENLS